MKIVKNNIKLVIGIVIGVIISVVTSYTLAETLIKSADVSYVDSAKLGATNVQAAIDGTCTKFSNDLQSFLLKVYPVGSIYISYDSTNPGTLFGGTWEIFGKGQTLVGIDTAQTDFDTVGKTGGSKSVQTILKETNLPSHSHTIPSLLGTTDEAGEHQHELNGYPIGWGPEVGVAHFVTAGEGTVIEAAEGPSNKTNALVVRNYLDQFTKSTGEHSHSITTIASSTTTCNNCKGNAFSTSTLQPYIIVYMWRRTK